MIVLYFHIGSDPTVWFVFVFVFVFGFVCERESEREKIRNGTVRNVKGVSYKGIRR